MNPEPSSWRRSIFRLLQKIGIIGGGSYVGVLIVLMFFENRMVYQPLKGGEPAPKGIEDVELTAENGVKIHAWWCKCKDADCALLYFHGNGGNLSQRGGSILNLVKIFKMSVLIVDYPGYGKSSGSPTETGCYAAADAGYDWLVDRQKFDPRQIVLYGASMGGGVAVDLASRKDHRALVLIKTFTSMPDVGQHLHPWLPVRWLMRNRFNNLKKIDFCHRPVLIANSPEDELVPFEQGQRLFEAAHEPKEFFTLSGGHNDSLPAVFFDKLRTFLRDRAPVTRPAP